MKYSELSVGTFFTIYYDTGCTVFGPPEYQKISDTEYHMYQPKIGRPEEDNKFQVILKPKDEDFKVYL